MRPNFDNLAVGEAAALEREGVLRPLRPPHDKFIVAMCSFFFIGFAALLLSSTGGVTNTIKEVKELVPIVIPATDLSAILKTRNGNATNYVDAEEFEAGNKNITDTTTRHSW